MFLSFTQEQHRLTLLSRFIAPPDCIDAIPFTKAKSLFAFAEVQIAVLIHVFGAKLGPVLGCLEPVL